jgi:hypothetical protein
MPQAAKCEQSRQSKSIGFRLIMHQCSINAFNRRGEDETDFRGPGCSLFAARIVTWVAVLSSVFLSVAFAENAAPSAQSPPAAIQGNPPPPATDTPWQAPIGHRQPRSSDLPSNVLRDENGVVRSPFLDTPDLTIGDICRPC